MQYGGKCELNNKYSLFNILQRNLEEIKLGIEILDMILSYILIFYLLKCHYYISKMREFIRNI